MGRDRPAGPVGPRDEAMDEALRALAEPRRRAILQLVAHSELSAGEIAGCFDVTRTAVSQHLTVLKNAGLLSERRLATRRLYRARPEGLAGLREFLDEMWASSLEVARDLVESDLGAAERSQASAAGCPAASDEQSDEQGDEHEPTRREQAGMTQAGMTEAGMTQDGEARAPGTVTALRRPPVRQSIVVRSGRRHTFDTFVRTIGVWWPVTPFSAGKDRVRDVTFELRQGGRVYETWQDGTEVDWGEVLVWAPPERFVMTWNMTSVVTEVELTFAELGPLLTRVAVEHRGWEQLTEEQLAADCALRGGYLGGAYREGWARILGCLAAATGGQS